MSAENATASDRETVVELNRRLSDKLRLAVKQAVAQGRDQVTEHLLLCNQAVAEEDDAFTENRRARD